MLDLDRSQIGHGCRPAITQPGGKEGRCSSKGLAIQNAIGLTSYDVLQDTSTIRYAGLPVGVGRNGYCFGVMADVRVFVEGIDGRAWLCFGYCF